MTKFTRAIVIAALLAGPGAYAAVHPTKAQQAYFDEHEKCASAFREARKVAKVAPLDQRKTLIRNAKETYRQCETHAHLVWKFYPQPPPPK